MTSYGTCSCHADVHSFTADCIGWRDEYLNAWPLEDVTPCAEVGEHLDWQRHPFVECPTYTPPEEA